MIEHFTSLLTKILSIIFLDFFSSFKNLDLSSNTTYCVSGSLNTIYYAESSMLTY